MANDYSQRWKQYGYTSMNQQPTPVDRNSQKRQKDAELQALIGSIAPGIGTALGGLAGAGVGALGIAGGPLAGLTIPAGAALGATIGGGLGTAVGGGLTASAENNLRQNAASDQAKLEAEMKKQALLQAIAGLRGF